MSVYLETANLVARGERRCSHHLAYSKLGRSVRLMVHRACFPKECRIESRHACSDRWQLLFRARNFRAFHTRTLYLLGCLRCFASALPSIPPASAHCFSHLGDSYGSSSLAVPANILGRRTRTSGRNRAGPRRILA